jgi:hypothetical protein
MPLEENKDNFLFLSFFLSFSFFFAANLKLHFRAPFAAESGCPQVDQTSFVKNVAQNVAQYIRVNIIA